MKEDMAGFKIRVSPERMRHYGNLHTEPFDISTVHAICNLLNGK